MARSYMGMARRLAILAGSVVVGFFLLVFLARAWLAEPGIPSVDSITQDLDAHRILLVFAHPDDEILATELIHRAVNEGAFVSLLTATRGERGSQFPAIVDQRHLGLVRAAETLKHGWALGVDEQEVLEFGDGGLADLPLDLLVESISGEVSRVRPDLLVTFHPASGITMHSDHRAIGEAVVQAGRLATSTGAMQRLRVAFVLAPRKGLRAFGGERERRVAELQPEPDFSLRADLSLKRRAWQIHESQRGLVRTTTGLPVWLAYMLSPLEYYAIETL